MSNKILSVEDEFVKMAYEKGWIVNAQGPDELAPENRPLTGDLSEVAPENRPIPAGPMLGGPEVGKEAPLPTSQKPEYFKSPEVGRVQTALNVFFKNYGMPKGISVDTVWGPETAGAWNYYAKAFGLSPVKSDGTQVPDKQEMDKFVKSWTMGQTATDGFTPKVPEWAKEDPYESMAKQLGKPVEMPKGEDITKELEEKMKKYNPATSPKGDEIAIEASKIINELIVLANELDELGEKEAAEAIDKQMVLYKSAIDKLYDITGETGEKFIETSHDKSPVIAPAAEEGGKVENVVEQQEADLKVMKKEPTGKYAETIMKLIVTANELDEKGDVEGAKLIDSKIAELSSLPFVNRGLVFEATDSEDVKASVKVATINRVADILAELNEFIGMLEEKKLDLATIVAGNLKKFIPIFTQLQMLNLNDKEDAVKVYGYAKQLKQALSQEILRMEQIDKQIGPLFKGSSILFKMFKHLDETTGELMTESQLSGNFTREELKKSVAPKKTIQKSPENIKEALSNRYKGTLNKILGLMRTNPQKAYKVFGGKLELWEKKLTEEISAIENKNADYLMEANNLLWNMIYKKLASAQHTIIKIAEEDLLSLLRTMKGVAPKTKRRPGIAPRKGDPQIAQLQKSLISAGFDVGPRGIDGVWGPATMAGWNRFVSKVEELSAGRPTRLETKTNVRVPPVSGEIEIAMRWADYLRKQVEKQLSAVDFEIKGKKFNTNDLESIDIFASALAREKLLVENYKALEKAKLNPIIWDNLEEAKKYLVNASDYIKNTFGEQAYKVLEAKINSLLTQIQQDKGTYKAKTTVGPTAEWEKATPEEIAKAKALKEKSTAPITSGTTGAPTGATGTPAGAVTGNTSAIFKEMALNNSNDIKNAIEQLRLSLPMLENVNLFSIVVNQMGGKKYSPEQYIALIERNVGKIFAKLNSMKMDYVGKFGEDSFNDAWEVAQTISKSLEILKSKLGEYKPRQYANLPHEAETYVPPTRFPWGNNPWGGLEY